MSVLLGYSTALEILRATPPQVRLYPHVRDPMDMRAFSTSYREVDVTALSSLGARSLPVNVLVARGARESDARDIRSRSFGLPAIPEGLMLELAPGIYSAGPELCFVQMARDLPLTDAVVLGCELCGRYSHFAGQASGFYERPPLTSVEQIERAIEQLSGLYGLSRAREALRWVRDGSRSPMETDVSCVLFLPGRHRGFGFGQPELNHCVELDEEASAITGTRRCYVDASWPGARRGVEYDSHEFHTDPARDLRRREALQHMGWDVYTIDLDRMTNFDELVRCASLFADDVPRQPGGPAPLEEVAELHRDLLRATRFGMGASGVLFAEPVAYGRVKIHL